MTTKISTKMVSVPTNVDKIFYCRCCAEAKKYDELIHICDDEETHNRFLYVVELLKFDFLDISDNNKLPKSICELCVNTINIIYEFLKKVKESQTYLKTLFSDIKKEIDNDIKHENSELDNETKFRNDESEINLEKPEMEEYYIELKHECPIIKEELAQIPSSKKSLHIATQKSTCSKKSQTANTIRKDVKQRTAYKEQHRWKTNSLDNSWATYPWYCIHCKAEFETMELVRSHSKEKHGKCYGFKCVDCYNRLNTFIAFVDHVRTHREVLRYHCQHCNQKFDNHTQCQEHATSHCRGTQKICDMCGEIVPDLDTLEHHKSIYKQFTYKVKRKPKLVAINAVSACGTRQASWSDYKWSCQVCNLSVTDADALRNHVQEVHNRCFSIKCMDCVMVMKNFSQFVSHVYKHRPYLKKFCQYCNKNIQNVSSLKIHIKNHMSGPQKPCDGCGQIFVNNILLKKHMKKYVAPRPSHTITAEDLICEICKKSFPTICKLREHKKTHDGKRKRTYTCESCGKAFLTLGTLKEHIKTHNVKTQVCKICQKAFCTKYNLKKHVLSHFEEKPFKCDDCGRTFTTKSQLKYHLKSHTGFKPHVCQYCGKPFRYTNDLKIHLHQHTGLRPYACEICEKTFTNRGNCNKHMVGIHGVSLSKKRKAPVQIIDEKTKAWMDALMKEKAKKIDKNSTASTV